MLGEGPEHAAIVFVGEQPGDREDELGRPFVGPAGQLLRRAIAEAGIDRREIYLTNAVKHFKFERRGKRRIHQTPTVGEVKHYRWSLEKELELIKPKLTVALGSSAAKGCIGHAGAWDSHVSFSSGLYNGSSFLFASFARRRSKACGL